MRLGSIANLLRGTERDDAVPALPQASEGKEIVTDCRAMVFTLDRHPLARCAIGWLSIAYSRPSSCSRCVAASSRACGLVAVRQRPGTANGVLLMTLEDKTGRVNVILARSAGEVSEGSARRCAARRLWRMAGRR